MSNQIDVDMRGCYGVKARRGGVEEVLGGGGGVGGGGGQAPFKLAVAKTPHLCQ